MMKNVNENEFLIEHVNLKRDVDVFEMVMNKEIILDDRGYLALIIDGVIFPKVRYFMYPIAMERHVHGKKVMDLRCYFYDIYRRNHIVFHVMYDACASIQGDGVSEPNFYVSYDRCCAITRYAHSTLNFYLKFVNLLIKDIMHDITTKMSCSKNEFQALKYVRKSNVYVCMRIFSLLSILYEYIKVRFDVMRDMCICGSDFKANKCNCRCVRDYVLNWKLSLEQC